MKHKDSQKSSFLPRQFGYNQHLLGIDTPTILDDSGNRQWVPMHNHQYQQATTGIDEPHLQCQDDEVQKPQEHKV